MNWRPPSSPFAYEKKKSMRKKRYSECVQGKGAVKEKAGVERVCVCVCVREREREISKHGNTVKGQRI